MVGQKNFHTLFHQPPTLTPMETHKGTTGLIESGEANVVSTVQIKDCMCYLIEVERMGGKTEEKLFFLFWINYFFIHTITLLVKTNYKTVTR